ncbi:MAG: site-specific integrase [Dysgonamonadaceae bacterium]|jgi:site-specific recombinase XerD|nr:site-specific integrase [Dysgonamonadaceae bacterium]
MKQEKFKVLLYLKKSGLDKLGKAPVMGRITVNKSMAQFSSKLSCTPDLWNSRESRLNGKSREAIEVNAKIEKILLAVHSSFGSLVERNQPFDAEAVKNLFQGSMDTQMTILRLFDCHIEEIKARIGIDISHRTLPNYLHTRKRLALFIKKSSNSSDLAFSQLNEQFIREFQDFLILEEGLGVETVRHYLAILKKICRIAFKEGHSDKHYFANYPLLKKKENPPRTLSREEFEKIRDLEIEEHRWSHVTTRDMFLFACYTGTAYVDVVAITNDNLSKDDTGSLWLKYQRGKNGKLSRVKLLPEAIELIEKYKNKSRETLFPKMEYNALKWNLQSIRQMVGIQGALTYHMGRHSFSSLITLEAGVPIETVSKMLGHSDIKTTQIYARVTPKKLFEDMNKYIEATNDLKLVL